MGFLLDGGRGTGATTRYLADKSGARFVGIDTAEPAIPRAQERAAASADRLAFKMGTMDALDFPAGSFDAVVVIDSLYSCKDPTATIGPFLRIWRTGGPQGWF